ncbi:MAG: DUF3261 domain-containing protein [Myxococcales bacterium]|nr:DUF3261 domain-containing protein [Myxococcales bacterium]MCB9520179.1 DUF3261 domain-containing protein [Myxococcales bacterium]MCB9531199.1 DUF3261 domain-containing protein [Myxococcales bacterium]
MRPARTDERRTSGATRLAATLRVATLAASALVSLVSASGCGGARGRGAVLAELAPLDAGPLLPPDTFAPDFAWRQRVTATWPTGVERFDAVVQKRGGVLTMIGLSPMGSPGFVISLDTNGVVTLDNRSGRELPFDPTYVIADVQRAFYPWPDTLGVVRLDEATNSDGTRVRRFIRTDAPERGEVRVELGATAIGDDVPASVSLTSGWFGYSLEIETVEQQRL